MDEEKRLVSELQSKLAELNQKVWKYRSDMAAEFEKYAEGLLQGVGEEVSASVSETISKSVTDYGSLYPDLARTNESGATSVNIRGSGFKLPKSVATDSAKSVLPHKITEEFSDEETYNPHEREKEFQGLFTPSYLPLLDSSSRSERRSSFEPPPLPPRPDGSREMGYMRVDASTDTRSIPVTPDATRPPTPRRRNTDEASVTSDISDGPVRRSALRRTSSSSKTLSPRRVRFDVEGEEVLPTSSPLSPPAHGDAEVPPTILVNDSDEEGAGDIGDTDSPPPPKRISSSQLLRQLSKQPPEDDGTTWTTVSAPPDGSPSVVTSNGKRSEESSMEDFQAIGGLRILGLGAGRGSAERLGGIGGHFEEQSGRRSSRGNHDLEEDASDDEMPAIRPKKGRNTQLSATILSPAVPQEIDANKPPTRPHDSKWQALDTLTGPTGKDIDEGMRFDVDDDEDDLFHFDESKEKRGSPPEELPEDPEDETESPSSPVEPYIPSLYSQSPARPIIPPTLPKLAEPAVSGSHRAAAGSFKGHPFNTPIVSEAIHAQAASLGAMQSFVGSVTGRSGVDESDLNSFRTTGNAQLFSGTPRSMSERMMMDDLKEAEESHHD